MMRRGADTTLKTAKDNEVKEARRLPFHILSLVVQCWAVKLIQLCVGPTIHAQLRDGLSISADLRNTT
jgi:hypothetical protein